VKTASSGTRVAAVIAACNHSDLTLAYLRSPRAQRVPGIALDGFVLDDASSDDSTSEAIADQFPEVIVARGDGQFYWNWGMRRGFAADYDLCSDPCKNAPRTPRRFPELIKDQNDAAPVARR
jgi:GT2 family glycosyltransferase